MAAQREQKRPVKLTGTVWCDRHGGLHGDSTDPFDTGTDECQASNHRPVYVWALVSEGVL